MNSLRCIIVSRRHRLWKDQSGSRPTARRGVERLRDLTERGDVPRLLSTRRVLGLRRQDGRSHQLIQSARVGDPPGVGGRRLISVATDGPMTDEEMKRAKAVPILHIPTVLGADAII